MLRVRSCCNPPHRLLVQLPSIAAVGGRGRRSNPRRHFSSCPFQVLGFPDRRRARQATNRHNRGDHAVTYDQVREAFRSLALKHHPDTNPNSSATEFTRIRDAFEAIVEGPSGVAVLRDDHPYLDRSEEEGNDVDVPSEAFSDETRSVFQDERNGFLHPSVNPQILHEVAEVAEKMNPGGLDKGGMWQYANMIRNMAEDDAKGGLPPLRVGGGDETGRESGTRSRRRRKRK